jgi:hypothetical protein
MAPALERSSGAPSGPWQNLLPGQLSEETDPWGQAQPVVVHTGRATASPSQPSSQQPKPGGMAQADPRQKPGPEQWALDTEPPGHCQPDVSQIGVATVSPSQPPTQHAS